MDDDLVERDFIIKTPNRLWRTAVAEHRTTAGRLCLCAIKATCSAHIGRYSTDPRTKSSLIVTALVSAGRGMVARSVIHSDGGSWF